jgi:multidrug resistance efflux pump
MALHDDEDELPITSHPENFTKADHGRKESLQRKASAKGKLLELKRAALRGQVDIKNMKQLDDVDRTQAPTPAQREAERPAPGVRQEFGTKSTADQAKEDVQTAGKVLSSDQLVQDAKRTEAVKRAAAEEYQQDAG